MVEGSRIFYSQWPRYSLFLSRSSIKVKQRPLYLGIAIAPGDPELVNWLNNFLTLLRGSGRLDMLGDKWFRDPGWTDRSYCNPYCFPARRTLICSSRALPRGESGIRVKKRSMSA